MVKKYYYIIYTFFCPKWCVCVFACTFWVYWLSAESPLSTVTPLSLISNIQSKRTSALKTNTNHTCYVTPLPIHEKNTSHFPSWKFQEKWQFRFASRFLSFFIAPPGGKKTQKNPPRKKTRWIQPGDRWYSGALYGTDHRELLRLDHRHLRPPGDGRVFFPRKLSQRRSESDECHGQPTPPPNGVSNPVRNKGFVTEKPWKYAVG